MPQSDLKTKSEDPKDSKDSPKKTLTRWNNFAEAGLIPTRLRCDGYLGSHPADMSCHTALIISKDNIVRHMDPAHGGGWFKIRFRSSDSGKDAPNMKVWKDLEDAGVEIQHLYCPHCRETLDARVAPQEIFNHLRPHAGANRVNQEPQTLCMTLDFHEVAQARREQLYSDEV